MTDITLTTCQREVLDALHGRGMTCHALQDWLDRRYSHEQLLAEATALVEQGLAAVRRNHLQRVELYRPDEPPRTAGEATTTPAAAAINSKAKKPAKPRKQYVFRGSTNRVRNYLVKHPDSSLSDVHAGSGVARHHVSMIISKFWQRGELSRSEDQPYRYTLTALGHAIAKAPRRGRGPAMTVNAQRAAIRASLREQRIRGGAEQRGAR